MAVPRLRADKNVTTDTIPPATLTEEQVIALRTLLETFQSTVTRLQKLFPAFLLPPVYVVCKQCGVTFPVPDGDDRRGRRAFCTNACKSRNYRERRDRGEIRPRKKGDRMKYRKPIPAVAE